MADIFDAFREKQRERFAKLSTCPSVRITGIVSESGVFGMQLTSDAPITFHGSFDAWRVESGPVQTIQPLGIVCHVLPDQMEHLANAMPSNAIVQIRGRLDQTDRFSTPAVLLEELIDKDIDDQELHERLELLLNPHTLEDPYFGTFRCQRNIYSYLATATWSGRTIELELQPDEPFDSDAAINVAKMLWSAMPDWNTRIPEYAASELLPLWNNCWRPTEELMSAKEFVDRLQLSSVSVCQTGSFSFHYSCGDLFGDHGVEVYGSVQDGLRGAKI